MSITRRAALLLWLWLIFSAYPTPAEAAGPPDFSSAPCPFAAPPGQAIECGYVTVSENRARPGSPTIQIGVTIIKSRSPQPAPDPIFYLRGGLGSSTRSFVEQQFNQLAAWLAKREVILFDQRGLGWSQPVLDCPEVHLMVRQQRLGQSLTLAEQLAPGLACRDRWLQAGVDLAAYNSYQTAADTLDIMQALGYDQVNLVSASYWTLVAQLVMADPRSAGRLRSVTLDSPVPLTVPVMAESPAQLAASLARLFRNCQADWLCRAAYPNLEQTYVQLLERLAAAPLTVWATNPETGQSFSFEFDVADLGYLLGYGSYQQLPGLIYDLVEGDYGEISRQREQFLREMARSNAGQHYGFRTTMNCNEPWQTVSPEQRAAMAVYPEAVLMDNPLDEALCRQWPAFTPPAPALPSGDVPTLIFSGAYDTRQPVAYSDLIAGSLNLAYAFTVPGAGHVTLASGDSCPNLMLLSFLDDPTRPPDSRCLTDRFSPGSLFTIRAAAARRPAWLGLGLMGLLLLGIGVGLGRLSRQSRQVGLGVGPTWRHSLRLVGWRIPLAGLGLVGLAYYAAVTRLVPFFAPAETLALVLPLVAAIQATRLFSPEDEPGLELLLATPRSPAWMLLERWLALLAVYAAAGLLGSLFLVYASPESWPTAISRWLPVLLGLSGLAVYITLAGRRSTFGLTGVCLAWFAATLFGDFIVARWPVAWLLHLYLPPSNADYTLNRLFLTGLGLSLAGLAITRLLGHTEWLLLGRRRAGAVRVNRQSGAVAGSRPDSWPVRPRVVVQLAAMVRYEFWLQWRRISLPALIAALAVTPLLGASLAIDDFRGYRAAVAAGTLAFDVAQAEITAAMLPVVWLGAVLVAILMVPPLAAEAVAYDSQAGVCELLAALPLSPGVYLAGKLLSRWAGLLLAVALAALVSGAAWWWLVGPFRLGLFLELWFGGVLLLMVINAGLSLILAAGQTITGRATLIGGGYTLLCLAGLSLVFNAPGSGWQWLNPARPALLLYYLIGFPGAVRGGDELSRAILVFAGQAASREQALYSLATGLIQLGLIWLIASLWLRRRTACSG